MNTCQVGENTLRPGTAAHLKFVASELARAISHPPSWLHGHTKFHKEACTKTPRKKEGKVLLKTSILLSPNKPNNSSPAMSSSRFREHYCSPAPRPVCTVARLAVVLVICQNHRNWGVYLREDMQQREDH